MKIFLDDIRDPQVCANYMKASIGEHYAKFYLDKDWTIVRNFVEFKRAFENNNIELITHVSFDHDLADQHYQVPFEDWELKPTDNEMPATGYDCAKWMIQHFEENNVLLPVILVHSMNPVGATNIRNAFKQ